MNRQTQRMHYRYTTYNYGVHPRFLKKKVLEQQKAERDVVRTERRWDMLQG